MKAPLIVLLTLPAATWLGCSADAENPDSPAPVAGMANGSRAGNSAAISGTGSGNAAGSSNASTGGGGSGGGDVPVGGGSVSAAGTHAGGSSGGLQKPLALPFFVNAPGNYVKSGFMGDAKATVTAAPSELSPDGTCGGARAPGAGGGDCDTFAIDAAQAGTEGWQGVFYQFPANNWGAFPGRTIAAGAKSVTLQARATRAVAVMFQVGMCDPKDATQCPDGFYAFPDGADDAGKVTVGTEWTKISVDLSGKDYSKGVHGAFSWSVSNDDLLGDTNELDLYLDAITWQ